jgi:hypothetical protein
MSIRGCVYLGRNTAGADLGFCWKTDTFQPKCVDCKSYRTSANRTTNSGAKGEWLIEPSESGWWISATPTGYLEVFLVEVINGKFYDVSRRGVEIDLPDSRYVADAPAWLRLPDLPDPDAERFTL